jgi:hypothetical protein
MKPGYNEIEFAVESSTGEAAYSNFHLFVTVQGCHGGCIGRVGDANGRGGDEPSIGDLSVMIDWKFIHPRVTGWCSLPEADINQSGGANPTVDDITVGDIAYLIDYLFIAGPSVGMPDCL